MTRNTLDRMIDAQMDFMIIVNPKSSPKSKSGIQVPNPVPKSRSQILNPKSRGNGLGLGLTLLSYSPPTQPTTHNFSHLKRQSSHGKRPSMTFLDLPWPSMTFYDLLWPVMTFYDFLWPSMIKCLLTSHDQISGPLHSSPNQFSLKSKARLQVFF